VQVQVDAFGMQQAPRRVVALVQQRQQQRRVALCGRAAAASG